MSINTITFGTRAGQDAETRFTPNQKAITSFRCPIETGWGDKKETGWVTALIFGERGEKLAQYITKGKEMTITGALKVREFEHNGQQRTAVEILVNDVALHGGKDSGGQQQSQQGGGPGTPQDDFDDDIPFVTSNSQW